MATSTSDSCEPRVLILAVAFGLGIDFRPRMKQLNDELVDAGYDPVCIPLENTPEYDAKLKQALDDRQCELVQVGGGVRLQTEWYGRVTKMIAESRSRDAVMTKPNGPDEDLQCVLQGLPLASTSEWLSALSIHQLGDLINLSSDPWPTCSSRR